MAEGYINRDLQTERGLLAGAYNQGPVDGSLLAVGYIIRGLAVDREGLIGRGEGGALSPGASRQGVAYRYNWKGGL